MLFNPNILKDIAVTAGLPISIVEKDVKAETKEALQEQDVSISLNDRVFNIIDVDGDGLLSKDEMKTFGRIVKEGNKLNILKIYERLVEIFDENHDEMLSDSEIEKLKTTYKAVYSDAILSRKMSYNPNKNHKKQKGNEALKNKLKAKFKEYNDELEVHLIGVYEGKYKDGIKPSRQQPHPQGYINVEITRNVKPLVLVFSSFEPVEWRLNIQEDVEIAAIIMGGIHKQNISPMPEGALLVNKTHLKDSRNFLWFYINKGQLERFKEMHNFIKGVLGHDIYSYQGHYSSEDYVISNETERFIHRDVALPANLQYKAGENLKKRNNMGKH